MIYDVRLREVLIHEFQVEEESLKRAFYTAMQKAHSKKFKNCPIAKYFEIESLNQGKQNELSKPKHSNKRRTRLPKKGKNSKT